MNATDYASELVEAYEPQVPIPELVEQLNRFFHANEARHYDAHHAKLLNQLTPIWREMLTVGLAGMGPRALQVLDFGCGTGFEATRLLNDGGGARIGQLVCYDLSPEMLQACRERLARFSCPITFGSDLDALLASGQRFDVLLTNSLLHHLPDPLGTLRQLSPLLADGAVWLAGHEPSSRFFRNRECHEAYGQFRRQQRFRKYLSPRKYIQYLKRMVFRDGGSATSAALEARNRGLVRKELPSDVVALFVDFHVAHSCREVEAGRGFDVDRLASALAGQWQLEWSRAYTVVEEFSRGVVGAAWRRKCRELDQLHSKDGSHFCAVWRRV